MEEDQNDSAFFSPYEAQLFALFKSCDQPGKGVLDREGLSSLCKKLGLDNDQSQKLLVSFSWLGIFYTFMMMMKMNHGPDLQDRFIDKTD